MATSNIPLVLSAYFNMEAEADILSMVFVPFNISSTKAKTLISPFKESRSLFRLFISAIK